MRSNKKHFVFLRNPPTQLVWGGLEKLVCEWFERIDYQQCQVTFVVAYGWRDIYQNVFKSKGFPITIVETNLDYSMNSLNKFKNMYQLLRKLRPTTCVFVQGRFFCFHFMHILAAWCIAKNVFMHENLGAPKPWVKSSNKYFGFIPGLALWWYAEKTQTRCRSYFCKKVLTVSQGVKDNLVDLWHYPRQKILVCHHGIDLNRFYPGINLKLKEELDIPSGQAIIIVSSRLSQEKYIDRVINAFDDLNDEALELVILGSGPLEADLKALAARKESKSRIRFLGHVENVSDYLRIGDYFVLSSDNEGLGLSLLEAMASGLLCLATPCPGPMEIIQDGINGFFIEKSWQGVREGLKKAMALSINERRQMMKVAMDFVKKEFELGSCVKNTLVQFEVPLKV